MTLLVEAPNGRCPERDYVLGVLLGDFLGLSWRREVSERQDVRITLGGLPGEIRLPDILFSVADADWLTEASMPRRPFAQWDTRDLAKDITLVDPTVPVIYGGHPIPVGAQPPGRSNASHGHASDDGKRQNAGAEAFAVLEDGRVSLPIDIFGSAFFMLSRYEELVTPDRDEHDRFPAWASLAYREGFLERPIVDEYVEILWAAMQRLWPGLQRKKRQPRTFVTCDVDNPYAAYTKTMAATLRKMGGDLLKRRSVPEAVRTLRNTLATRRGDYRHDPFDTFDWMMGVNEAAGNRMAFYFIVDHSVPGMDGHYSIDEPRIRQLMRRIHERGHEIGLHGSYGTYRDPAQIRHEVERLRAVMAEEAIDQEVLGCRQHYLRWDSRKTAQYLSDAGFHYDTTLSFADHAGFRCGTCHAYALYDLLQRCPLLVKERPLVLMECSVLSPVYGGHGYSDKTLRTMRRFKEITQKFGGEFVLLWHNSYFQNTNDRYFYQRLVSPERTTVC
ncbi:polysaccharide deacetylase family protein [Thioalkalivibrio sp. AKL8]|uniref:polysaccharide deacetylase family protein n=1 Tax=Thioalkalivibrio sp. AKL8 TaxID=1158156 RepID=UPI00037995A0|nr:polysaccharide deacetylase family protein [Thioalkalivibrio sp. AKL8]